MSSATEYQAVPTTTTTTTTTTKKPTIWSENLRRCTGYPTIFTMVVLCVGFGVPLIILGVIEYVQVGNFSTQPGTCHVNAIGIEQKTGWRLSSSAFPVWNVDVVQELQSDSETKNLVVLHSNLKIRGHGDYRNRPLTLEDAGQLYSVGKIYPCYVYKQLLNKVDNTGINLKHAIQWRKPSRKSSIIDLSAGLILVAIGIIILIIGILFNYRK